MKHLCSRRAAHLIPKPRLLSKMYLTAFLLRNSSASKPSSCRNCSSSCCQSAGGAKLTVGKMRTSAPSLSSSRINSPACSGARVTTMRFPASGWLALSNGPSRELQNPARSRCKQFLCDFAAERLSFFLRTAGSRSASANAFRTIGRKDARVENQFRALESPPGTERKPATALQVRQYRSFCGHRERCCAIHPFLHKGEFVCAR